MNEEVAYVLVLLDSYSQLPYEALGQFPDEDSAWSYYTSEYDGFDAVIVPLIELDG